MSRQVRQPPPRDKKALQPLPASRTAEADTQSRTRRRANLASCKDIRRLLHTFSSDTDKTDSTTCAVRLDSGQAGISSNSTDSRSGVRQSRDLKEHAPLNPKPYGCDEALDAFRPCRSMHNKCGTNQPQLWKEKRPFTHTGYNYD